MITCPKCNKPYKNQHGLNVHDYLAHGKGRKAKRGAVKYTEPPAQQDTLLAIRTVALNAAFDIMKIALSAGV